MKTFLSNPTRAFAGVAFLFFACRFGAAVAQATTVSCDTVAACVFAQNSGAGNGAEVRSAKGSGLLGTTLLNAANAAAGRAGVAGYDKSTNKNAFNSGVYGTSPAAAGVRGESTYGTGVQGSSENGFGVVGATAKSCPGSCAAVAGVAGYDTAVTNARSLNTGVYGSSQYGYGVTGVSANSDGVDGFSSIFGVRGTATGQNGTGVLAVGDGANSIGLFGAGAIAVFAEPNPSSAGSTGMLTFAGQTGGVMANTESGGGTIEGPAFLATTATTDATSALPPLFIGTNYNSGNDVVSIDASGNMILAGSLMQKGSPLIRTRSATGQEVATFGERASSPNVEDVGEGRLVDGTAYVRLDPAFAATIDVTTKYFVFVTPQGDNHGLYVTALGPQGFAVKESSNGRSSLAFDYRIVAKPLDSRAMRLPAMTAFAPLRHGLKKPLEWARLRARATAPAKAPQMQLR